MFSSGKWTGLEVLLAVGLPVLIATAALIWIGLRGRHAWASPYCRKCKYDLRGKVPEDTPTCPECGADMQAKRAIGYVRHRPRWSLVALGFFVLISPGLVWGGFRGYAYAKEMAELAAKTSRPVSALSAADLPDQPASVVVEWVGLNINDRAGWDELLTRFQNGSLGDYEALMAFDHIIEYMRLDGPTGFRGYLYSEDTFVAAIHQAGLIDDERLRAYVDAFYGVWPRVTLERIEARSRDTEVEIRYGHYNEIHHDTGLPYRMIWAMHPVQRNGERVEESRDRWHYSNFIRTRLETWDFKAGEHKLDFAFEIGLFDANDLVGYDEDEARIEDWPEARLRWTQRVTVPLIAYDYRNPPVVTTLEADSPPGPDNFTIEQAVIRHESGNLRRYGRELGIPPTQLFKVYLEVQGVGSIDVPLSMTPVLYLGENKAKLSELVYSNAPDSDTEWELEGFLPEPPEAVDTARLVLVPDPEHLYPDASVSECWGKAIEIGPIAVKRLYREDAEPTEAGESARRE